MEIFDVCDEKGIPTGEVVSREEAHRNGIRHRTAHIWVARYRNHQWEILLQKRSMDKDSFPGQYDTSSAGHIHAGDEPLISGIRELREELGISASADDLIPIGTFTVDYELPFHGAMFKDKEVSFVYAYLRPVATESLSLQKEEVESVDWFELEKTYQSCLAKDPKFCIPLGGLELIHNYLNHILEPESL